MADAISPHFPTIYTKAEFYLIITKFLNDGEAFSKELFMFNYSKWNLNSYMKEKKHF